MAKVLLAWELGDGLGHVHKLLPIARALAAHGHEPVMALYNIVDTFPVLRNDSLPILQAPIFPPRLWRGAQRFSAGSFADVLAIRGWDQVNHLRPLVDAWQQLIDLVQPRLIVADFSPTVCLTAYGVLPVVQVGFWFYMPPADGATFPPLAPGQPPVLPQERILEVVRELQARRGRPIPETLPAVLATDRFLTCFPEVDGYASVRREPCWDPLAPLLTPTPPPAAPRFFAYLDADNQDVEPILTELALTGVPGTTYLRSAPAVLKDRLRLQGLQVLDEPAPMADILEQSSLIVHHGGTTLMSALSAGRPQLVLPKHLEQIVNGQMLHRLGVAISLIGTVAPAGAARALLRLLQDPRFARQALALGQELAARPRRPTLPAIVDCCLKHLS